MWGELIKFIDGIKEDLHRWGACNIAQTVKNLPAMQETRIRSLDQGDPLEKGMAIHSNILAWKIPWTEEAGGLQCVGSQSPTQLSD